MIEKTHTNASIVNDTEEPIFIWPVKSADVRKIQTKEKPREGRSELKVVER